MPKPSLNPDKARHGGGGPEAGNYEVLTAKFQNIKSDYKSNQLHLVLHSALLDKDGDRVRGTDETDLMFSFGQKSLESFQPATVTGPDDDSPDPKGNEPDAEGNSVYAEAGAEFQGASGAVVFTASLVKLGFPKDVLDQCYAPVFEGMKFYLDTKTSKEVNELLGLSGRNGLNTKPIKDDKGNESTVTYKIATKWLNPAYLKAAGGSKDGKKAPPDDKSADAPAGAEERAQKAMDQVAKLRAGKPIKTMQSLKGFFTNCYIDLKFPQNGLAAAQKFVADEAWVKNYVEEELGGEVKDDGSVSFPA